MNVAADDAVIGNEGSLAHHGQSRVKPIGVNLVGIAVAGHTDAGTGSDHDRLVEDCILNPHPGSNPRVTHENAADDLGAHAHLHPGAQHRVVNLAFDHRPVADQRP